MIDLALGEILVFDSAWEYQGPALPNPQHAPRIRVRIGELPLGVFRPFLEEDVGLSQGASPTWGSFSMRQFITLAAPLAPGNIYALEVEIYEGSGPLRKRWAFWEMSNAVRIPGIVTEPEFRNLNVEFGKG